MNKILGTGSCARTLYYKRRTGGPCSLLQNIFRARILFSVEFWYPSMSGLWWVITDPARRDTGPVEFGWPNFPGNSMWARQIVHLRSKGFWAGCRSFYNKYSMPGSCGNFLNAFHRTMSLVYWWLHSSLFLLGWLYKKFIRNWSQHMYDCFAPIMPQVCLEYIGDYCWPLTYCEFDQRRGYSSSCTPAWWLSTFGF